MFCINCGKKIPDGSKYCMYCGTDIEVYIANSQNNKKKIENKISDKKANRKINNIVNKEVSKAAKEEIRDTKQINLNNVIEKRKKIISIIKSRKLIIFLCMTSLILILIITVFAINFNGSIKNINSNTIKGTWKGDTGIKLTVTDNSYSFVEDADNPEENCDEGKYQVYSGEEGLQKAGYSDDKISEIISEYKPNQIITMYTTTEKQNISGINVSNIKNKNDYYIFILKNEKTASGIRILDEKSFHLKKSDV